MKVYYGGNMLNLSRFGFILLQHIPNVESIVREMFYEKYN